MEPDYWKAAIDWPRISTGIAAIKAFIKDPVGIIKTVNTAAMFNSAKKIYGDGLLSLSDIDESDWPNFRSGLRQYAALRSRYDVMLDRTFGVSSIIVFFLIAVDIVILTSRLHYTHAVATGIVTGFAAVLAAIGIMALIVKVVPSGIGTFFQATVLVLAPVAVMSVTLAANGQSFQHPWQVLPKHGGKLAYIVTGGAVICVSVMTIMAIFVLVFSLVITPIILHINGPRPDMHATIMLIALLRNLDKTPLLFGTVKVKTLICHNLEHVAICLEDTLPATVGLTDPVAKKELQERFNNGAAYLRQLQVRVVLADSSTLSELRASVAKYIAILIESKYALLPAEAPAVSKTSNAQKVIRVARTLLVAVIPLGCIVGARYAGIKLSGPLSDWVIIVALLWAALSLISLIDPTYKARIDEMNSIASVFRKDRS